MAVVSEPVGRCFNRWDDAHTGSQLRSVAWNRMRSLENGATVLASCGLWQSSHESSPFSPPNVADELSPVAASPPGIMLVVSMRCDAPTVMPRAAMDP